MTIYGTKDVKIGFNSPFLQHNDSVAIRTFEAAVNDERGAYYQYPQDLELWKLGEFDEVTGIITGIKPEYIIGGKDVKRRKDNGNS